MKQASDMNIEFSHTCLRCEEPNGSHQNQLKQSKRAKKCVYQSYKKLKQEQFGYQQYENPYDNNVYPPYNNYYVTNKNPFDQFNSLKGKQQHNIVDGKIMFITNKPLIPVYYDNYQFIDTLIQQYGGKKLFLSEQEIKQLQGQVSGIRVEVVQSDSNSNQNENDSSSKNVANQQVSQQCTTQQNQQQNTNQNQQQGQNSQQKQQQNQQNQQNGVVAMNNSENKKKNNKYKENNQKNQEGDKNERMTRSHKAKKQ